MSCQTRGCQNQAGRNRFCTTCRRQASLREAEAAGRWKALRPEIGAQLRHLLKDLLVLTHPDAHRGTKRAPIAAAVFPVLQGMRDE